MNLGLLVGWVAFAHAGCGCQADDAWVMVSQERVQWRLNDLGATFDGSQTYRGTGYPVVCGRVARQAEPAYERYVVAGEAIILESRVTPREMDYTWAEFCR